MTHLAELDLPAGTTSPVDSTARDTPWIDGRFDTLIRVLRQLQSGTAPSADAVVRNAATEQFRRILATDVPRSPEHLLAPDRSRGPLPEFLPLSRLLCDAETRDVERAVRSVLPTGQFTSGPWVGEFETALTDYLDLPHVATSSSGTEALMAALTAVGVRPGHEVVIPANSFAATENAVLAIGAEPVLCDVRPGTFGLDPEAIPGVLSARTAAVLPVHLYGRRAEMAEISRVAADHGVPVVEDACQAIGLSGLGRHSDAIALSFNPYKNLGGCGKSGAVATRDPAVAERAERYLYHGFARNQKNRKHDDMGLNARIDNLQAAVLLARMSYLALNNMRRLVLADRYRTLCAELDRADAVETPSIEPDHAWHLFTVQVDAHRRDRIRERMAELGAPTDLYYPVLSHQQPTPSATRRFGDAHLPATEDAHARMFQLPLFPSLTRSEQDRVVEALGHALRSE